MGILSISATMYKFAIALALVLAITSPVLAQEDEPKQETTPKVEVLVDKNDRYHALLPDNATAEQTPSQADVIEAVGTIIYSTVPIHSAADKSSSIIRYAIPGEKMTIVASNDEWFGVHMYNGKTGFIEQHNLKTVKVFYDERLSAGYIDKRLDVELEELVSKFNSVLRDSIYIKKYQIVPQLTLISAIKRDETITITMDYCAVDLNGRIVPSRQKNDLHQEMTSFIELIFMKLLTSMDSAYEIIVRKPLFSPLGKVQTTKETYVELKLEHSSVSFDNIKSKLHPDTNILSVVKSNMDIDELFKDFPH